MGNVYLDLLDRDSGYLFRTYHIASLNLYHLRPKPILGYMLSCYTEPMLSAQSISPILRLVDAENRISL